MSNRGFQNPYTPCRREPPAADFAPASGLRAQTSAPMDQTQTPPGGSKMYYKVPLVV